MGRYIMPSRWGMKTIDLIAVLVLVAVLVHWLLPTTGLAGAISTGAHVLAQAIAWLSSWIVQFLNWL